MPASTRLIRRRIKSVGNTKKITKAMEMVSASKMRKAVNAVVSTRPYSDLAWKMVGEIGRTVDVSLHPLLRKSENVQNILVVVVASDRGLAGSYNAQVGRTLTESLKKIIPPQSPPFERGENERGARADFITVGKKAERFVRKISGNITATFTNLGNNPTSLDIRPLAGLLTGEFISGKPPHPNGSGHEPENEVNIGCGGKYDRVYLLYTDFQSALRQIPRLKQLLPVERDMELGVTASSLRGSAFSRERSVAGRSNPIGEIATSRSSGTRNDSAEAYEYKFEPNPKQVLDLMLPRIVETQVFQSILESNASEHSARMMAMKNATDAAGDMIDDLTFTFNQIRQAAITREIAEISAGKMALE